MTVRAGGTSSNTSTPSLSRCRFPAEWEPHAATWLAWPHYFDDWPGKFEPIPWVYAEIIRHLARHERVELIVNDASSEKRPRKVLERANALSENNLRFHRWPTNRVWTRDSGCTFAKSGAGTRARESREAYDSSGADASIKKRGASAPEAPLAAMKWRFNAWAKYANWQRDEKIGSLM